MQASVHITDMRAAAGSAPRIGVALTVDAPQAWILGFAPDTPLALIGHGADGGLGRAEVEALAFERPAVQQPASAPLNLRIPDGTVKAAWVPDLP
jgi:hypothetical protein